jgi:hypothetical protein
MKKTVLFAALLVTVFSATAYTGYNGPEDEVHALGASGSSSASQSVGPNGTDWKMTFTEHAAGPSNQSTGVFNESFDNTSVSFEGVIQTPTPCYSLEAEVESDGENSYLFNVTSYREDGKEVCPQVVSYRKYNATFQEQDPYRLEVVHGGESVANLTHPDYRSDDGSEKKRRRGVLSGLFSFFRGLF